MLVVIRSRVSSNRGSCYILLFILQLRGNKEHSTSVLAKAVTGKRDALFVRFAFEGGNRVHSVVSTQLTNIVMT